MGLYTETIKNRIRTDEEAVKKADAVLLNEFVYDKTDQDRMRELRMLLDQILCSYGLSSEFYDEAATPDELLEYVLEPLGVLYSKIDMTDPAWKENTDYTIGFLEDGSPILITPSLTGHCYQSARQKERKRLSSKTEISSVGYAVYRPLDEGDFTLTSFIRYILKIIPIRFWVIIGSLSALAALLNLTVPFFNRLVLKEYVPMGRSAVPYIISAIIAFGAAGIIRCTLNAVNDYVVSLYKLRITKQTQVSVIARVLSLPVSFFRNNGSGKVATYVKNTRALTAIAVEMIFYTSVTLAFSLLNIPQMAVMSGPLTAAGLSLLIIQTGFTCLAASISAKYQKLDMDADSELGSNMFTTIKGIQKIKTAGAESRVYVKWAAIFKNRLEYSFDPPLLAKLNNFFIPTLSTALFYITAWYCHVPAVDFIAFSASYAIMSAAVSKASEMFAASYSANQYVKHIRKLFYEKSGIHKDQKILKNIKGMVRLENINFSYNPNDTFKMDGINMTIQPGEFIGITGRSGCGKSTLLNLIVGIIQPLSGTIYIDNYAIDTLNMRFVNRRIGFVTQYSALLPGSIRYNVSMGNDEITDDEVWEALRKAQIADIVSDLPDGLDTLISETASGGFSGGQKQCLLLARAFARKPKLLILDEATSALDNNTQAEVLKEIYKSKATVIMVAHRLSTIRGCDRIFTIENGSIVEEGTYDELMDRHGLFEQLVISQEAEND